MTPTKRADRIALSFLPISLRWLSSAVAFLLVLGTAEGALAAVRYVDVNSASPTAPYGGWATASRVIQDAVNVALPGDTVLVTNGVYATSGRAVSGTMTNRVAIEKALWVTSVNGPAVTVIMGAEAPEGGNGEGAIRCAYLAANAVLSGFTLRNGHTRGAAGDYYGEQSGGGLWCEVGGIVSNCVITANSSYANGGGAYNGALYNCALTGNSAASDGGGAWSCALYNCMVTSNSALGFGGTLGSGGGVAGGTLYNCIVYFNRAHVGPNFAPVILLDQPFDPVFNYCCTTPLPTNGIGNIAQDPQLASATHLSASSPCIRAGNPAYSSGVDIDGERWLNTPSMGADEFVAGGATGTLAVALQAVYTNVAIGFPLSFVTRIEGRTTASAWNFGDGTVLSNQPFATHVWNLPGTYPVKLTAYNDSLPTGVCATVEVRVVDASTYHVYVNQSNPTPVFPYTNWQTAAQTLQDAMDAAPPGVTVLVTNGVYAIGGRAVFGAMTNRVTFKPATTLLSVNGPAVTMIMGAAAPGGGVGDGGIRCVYLNADAILSGFTLTNGHTRTEGGYYNERSGGGLWGDLGSVATNCIFTGNVAAFGGGGAAGGSFYNCLFTGNAANGDDGGGGGAFGEPYFGLTLYDCILTGNRAGGKLGSGGGVRAGTLYHCTVASNRADGPFAGGGGTSGGQLYSCMLIGNSCADSGGGAAGGTLYNCALNSNSAVFGGGAHCATLYNCILKGNSASTAGGGATGGGSGGYEGVLYNCLLTGNSSKYGGGDYGGRLYNCTLAANSGSIGGGAFSDPYATTTFYNCIVYANTAPEGSNYIADGANFNFSCTVPMPTNGIGNITNAPLFLDLASGNLRVKSISPCINAGNNVYLSGTIDLDGNPRVTGGTIDIGAYEFPTPSSVISFAWLQRYGLPSDGSADYLDGDLDGMNNWEEWRAGTDPSNALSVLRLLRPSAIGANVILGWQSVAGMNYFLERSMTLSPAMFMPLATNLPGQSGTTTFTDTNVSGALGLLYRIGVAIPNPE